jgi:ribosomal protein L15
MTNQFFAAMVLNPFVIYVVGMSLVIGLAVIFLLSLRYYIKAKDIAPYLHKIEELIAAGAVKGNVLVKILGNGELTAKVEVVAHAFSKSAEAAIQAVGGTATKI